MKMKILTRLVALGISLSMATSAWAHGVDLPKPTSDDLKQTQPPLAGSADFARELLGNIRNKLAQPQLVVLDSVLEQFAAADRIRAGEAHDATLAEADYHRWRAEQSLLKLLSEVPDLIALDFRQGSPSRHPDTSLTLDSQFNLLLLKIFTGTGATNFAVHEMNMTTERDPKPYLFTIASNATTFIVVKLDQVPSDQTIFHVAFQYEGAKSPSFRWALSFVTKPGGQLAVEVLDENGQSTPVLLRLTAKPSQRLFEPAGAVDLSPMMNDVTSLPIYGPGRGYMVYIPGPFQGRYWIVPKPFEMGLPAGEWEIHILHGIEYEPVHDTFRVEPGQWSRKTYRLKRWTNMPQRGWYSGDDHVHSRLMSSEDAEKLLAFTRAGDIHVANVLEMGNEMRTWYAQRGFGPEFRVRDEAGLHWLVPGQEDPRSMLGHAIGLNLTAKVRDLNRYYLNDWVAEDIHKQGGLYGHTHVGAKALFVEREMALFTPLNIVDFNSIMQAALNPDYFYDFLNMGFKMTASAGTDTPYGGTVGCVRLYANCGTNKPFTADAWFAALKAGRTFVTTGPMVDFQVESAGPGDEITVTNDRPLTVKIRAWGLRGGSAPAKLQLIQFGKVIHEVTATREDQDQLELTTTVPAGHGGWLAAYAVGHDRSEAITTPVYVVRKGFRFWDPAQAAALIQRQLAVLSETEKAVQEAQAAIQAGRAPLDYYNRWPAEQATALRERITKVRTIYQKLQRDLEREQTLRAAR
jgi:hypothetical protein